MKIRKSKSDQSRKNKKLANHLLIKNLLDSRTAKIGLFLVSTVVAVFVVSFFWTPYDPTFMNLEKRFQAPNIHHLMGTDQFGRDIFSRIMVGSQVSLSVSFAAVFGAFFLGTSIGVLTGFIGGKIDIFVTRIVDVLLAIPALVFALGIVAILGPSAKSVSIALIITYARQFARITRDAVVSIKNKSYIEASIGLGHKTSNIIYKDVLPSIFPIITVQVTAALAWGILDEASLGFLGLGVQPPDTSWGSLLIEGRQYAYQAWWIAFFGGVPVTLSVFGINMLGDGLRDMADPRSSRNYFPKKDKKGKNKDIKHELSDSAEKKQMLEIKNLSVDFLSDAGTVRAVSNVSLSISQGEIVGLVGESASGKSTLALSILKLLPNNGQVVSGEVVFQGKDILELTQEEMRLIRGDSMTYVPQDALAAMNPVTRVEEQLTEIIRDHGNNSRKFQSSRALELLKLVKLKDPERNLNNFPHELSGGMQQRVVIAKSLALEPKLLIADEPTTALDVSVQAGILELIKNIRKNQGSSIIFITHDLAIVAELCDRVAVMYAGSIIETGTVTEIFSNPKHPYTRSLIGGLLPLNGVPPTRLKALDGQPPRTGDWPSGCAFHPRCPLYEQLGKPVECRTKEPKTLMKSDMDWVTCNFPEIEISGMEKS
jgi:peptide/nickel transport system permease protein